MTNDHPDHPMVQYLNSLRTQEEGANPTYVEENRRVFLESLRRGAPWFPEDASLRIETRLDRLVDMITNGTVGIDVVILTGDAGDGKTAVCAKIAAALGHRGDLHDLTTVGAWTIVKDASEVEEERLEELLAAHLRGRGEGKKLLVAINEGRLRRLVHRGVRAKVGEGRGCPALAELWPSLIEPALAAWSDDAAAASLDATMRKERVAVVNFRHRMHLREAVPLLLARWTAAEHWERSPACSGCPMRAKCPIVANAADLREPTVQTRVAEVLASAHFSGHRLPFRRLQAVLAIACTGGLRCADVQSGGLAAPSTTSVDRLQYRFYEALFYRATTRPVAVRPEPVARAFAPADPGAIANFEVDQEIAALATTGGPTNTSLLAGRPLPLLEQEAVGELQQRLNAPTTATKPQAELAEDLGRLTRNLRRWVALTASEPDAAWRRSLLALEAYADSGNGEILRRKAVAALNRLHRLPARNDEQLVSRQIDPASFRNPTRLALELDLGTEFEVRLRKGPVLPSLVEEWLEACPSEIELEAFPVGDDRECARLRLDARLLEILEGVEAGFTLLTGLGPYRRELARFHAHLVALAGRKRDARVLLRVDDRVYRLAAASTNGKLRFEGV